MLTLSRFAKCCVCIFLSFGARSTRKASSGDVPRQHPLPPLDCKNFRRRAAISFCCARSVAQASGRFPPFASTGSLSAHCGGSASKKFCGVFSRIGRLALSQRSPNSNAFDADDFDFHSLVSKERNRIEAYVLREACARPDALQVRPGFFGNGEAFTVAKGCLIGLETSLAGVT